MNESLQLSRLANGIDVISRHVDGAQSTAIGIWLENGARHQLDTQSGYAHLLEHLLFRRTRHRDGPAMSRRFEAMGGQINAETGRELTAYHGTVPYRHAPELLRLLLDMLYDSAFTEQDLEVEREVVLQELAMLQDDPETLLEDFATECVWSGHAMGWQILGSEDSLHASRAEEMHQYRQQLLRQARISVVISGHADHEALVRICDEYHEPREPRTTATRAPVFQPQTRRMSGDFEQTHMLWIMPASAIGMHNRATREMTNHLLAGGYSSRLYQEIRELRGLVYHIQSRVDYYSDTGLWMLQTSTDAEQAKECRERVEEVIDKLVRQGPEDQERQLALEHMQSSLLLEEDDHETCMDRMARDHFYEGRIITLEERLAAYHAVNAGEMREALADSWAQRAYFSAGGDA